METNTTPMAFDIEFGTPELSNEGRIAIAQFVMALFEQLDITFASDPFEYWPMMDGENPNCRIDIKHNFPIDGSDSSSLYITIDPR